MHSRFTSYRDARHALATETLGFDPALVAAIEQFNALGIDVPGLQGQPEEEERPVAGRLD